MHKFLVADWRSRSEKPLSIYALTQSAFITNINPSIENIKTFVTNVLTLLINVNTFTENIKSFVSNVLMFLINVKTFITNVKAIAN
ncbi:MAG: hypothetical protein HXY43_01540 [Fischerella sp.]|uniref:hypothetical protein n=1 Tax=Fischerella sp. TaxID=1191 RepID=UPI00180EA191|nr:hypothetical protein [Fischerella sp.]NWF58019.1 hypothetical protein [Fischerella sp.]